MRISDWRSDVCSSDLNEFRFGSLEIEVSDRSPIAMSIFAFHRHPIVAVEIERAAQEIEMRLVSARGTVIAAVLGYLPISDEFAFRLNQGLPKPSHIPITRGSGCLGNRFYNADLGTSEERRG